MLFFFFLIIHKHKYLAVPGNKTYRWIVCGGLGGFHNYVQTEGCMETGFIGNWAEVCF